MCVVRRDFSDYDRHPNPKAKGWLCRTVLEDRVRKKRTLCLGNGGGASKASLTLSPAAAGPS